MNPKIYHLKDNAEGQLDSGINASALTIVLGSGQGAEFPAIYRSTTTSGGTSTTLNKTGIGSSGIAVGDFIENITDGSYAYVLTVSTDSLTTSELQGGSDNTWQSGDTYASGRFVGTINSRNAVSGAITASEKVLVGNRSGDTITIETGGRGYDGSTAQSWVTSDYFSMFVTVSFSNEVRKALGDLARQIDLKASIVLLNNSLAARLWKDPVVVATTAAGTLSSSFENGDTVDGVVLATGDRILIKNQASALENGIYTVNASGAPTRATDFDATAEITGAAVTIIKGTANADTVWICTSDSPVVGTDAINFAQVGASLSKASTAQAMAGSDDSTYMTPLKVGQATQRRAITLAENLVQGNTVEIISSSGTKVQKAKITQAAAVSAINTLFATNTSDISEIIYIQKYDVFVYGFRDTADTNKGKVIVGRVDQYGNIQVGTPVTFESNALTLPASAGGNLYRLGMCWDSVNERLVIAYGDGGDSNKGKAIVGQLNSLTLSVAFGTKVTIDSTSTMSKGCVCDFDATNGKVVIGFIDSGASSKSTAIVGTVSGTSISFGTKVIIDNTATQDSITLAFYESVSGKVIFCYDLGGIPKLIVGTVSGTSISFGTAVQVTAGNTLYYFAYRTMACYDTVNGKMVMQFYAGNNAKGHCVVCTISGTSISVGTPVEVDSTASWTYANIFFDQFQGKTVNVYNVTSHNYYRLGTVSGTSISFSSTTEIVASNLTSAPVVWLPFLGKFLEGFSSSGIKAYLVQVAGDYGQFDAVIGVMQEAGSATESKMVVLEGGICNGFTSKTPGNKVYINTDWTVTETPTPYPIGRWVSDTELLVTKTP